MGLLSFAEPLLGALREGGAAGSCWSGAGSTMLGLATADKAEGVASAARTFLHDQGVAGIVHVLEADRTGLVTS
jgi:homoserine kinase